MIEKQYNDLNTDFGGKIHLSPPDNQKIILSPQRIAEKAAILETALNKHIAKQTDPSELQIIIDRKKIPDAVIEKALLQVMPRHNVQPRAFLPALRDLMKRQISQDKPDSIKLNIDEIIKPEIEDLNGMTRVFHVIASEQQLIIRIQGVPERKSVNGSIAKAYFDHKLSAGKMLKGGIIDFKEINKFPIVNSGDNLFYVQKEQQGIPGLSFEGKPIPVDEALPYPLETGAGVERIDDIDSSGTPKGYYLRSQRTGVVLLDRNDQGKIIGIDIQEQIEVKKLDYSVGNIGTEYTCPVSMQVGEICAGFKIRVNGRVEADIIDGGEIITNNEAVIAKSQSGSSILALKDITISTVTHSKVISERGTILILNELIDSELSAPEIIFERRKGLVTNNRIEAERLNLKGCCFSAENIIFFGNNLFADERESLAALEQSRADRLTHENKEKLLMGQLQLELKRLTKLAANYPDLVEFIRPLIVATQSMDYQTIWSKLEMIEKRNNTKVVANVRKIFAELERLPDTVETCVKKEIRLSEEIKCIRDRMTRMTLTIEGYLRRAGTIKFFCGLFDKEKKIEPDFIIESEGAIDTHITINGTYSRQAGFELTK